MTKIIPIIISSLAPILENIQFYLSLVAFLNSLTASPKPLMNSGIFLPPKRTIRIKAIIIISGVPRLLSMVL